MSANDVRDLIPRTPTPTGVESLLYSGDVLNGLIAAVGAENAPRIIGSIMGLLSVKPQLREATVQDLIGAALYVDSLGLVLHPSAGHVGIALMSGKPAVMVQWRGLAQIGMSAGVTDFDCQLAYKGEVVKFNRAKRVIDFDDNVSSSKPDYVYPKKDAISSLGEAVSDFKAQGFVGAWAYIVTPQCVTKWHYVTLENALEWGKRYSPSFPATPEAKFSEWKRPFWVSDLPSMVKKTAYRALKQFIPMAPRKSEKFAQGEIDSERELSFSIPKARSALWGDEESSQADSQTGEIITRDESPKNEPHEHPEQTQNLTSKKLTYAEALAHYSEKEKCTYLTMPVADLEKRAAAFNTDTVTRALARKALEYRLASDVIVKGKRLDELTVDQLTIIADGHFQSTDAAKIVLEYKLELADAENARQDALDAIASEDSTN